MSITDVQDFAQLVTNNVEQVIVGKRRPIELLMVALLCQGHVLIEDVPGVGKTMLARSIAISLGGVFKRLQCTPDLMPNDVTGVSIFNQQTSDFEFRPGPIFHHVVLADELNRAPPRTQSALLEAMGQGQVSLDGVTHALPPPFTVIATQNPLDLAGTYPLPDSQLDRFLLRLALGHLDAAAETQLLVTRRREPLWSLEAVATAADLLALQEAADGVQVSTDVAEYAVRLVAATRSHPEIERGISTRAALALMSAARALALWDSRDFVTPLDLRTMLVPAFGHRLLLRTSSQGAYARDEAGHLLEELARRVPAPR